MAYKPSYLKFKAGKYRDKGAASDRSNTPASTPTRQVVIQVDIL